MNVTLLMAVLHPSFKRQQLWKGTLAIMSAIQWKSFIKPDTLPQHRIIES